MSAQRGARGRRSAPRLGAWASIVNLLNPELVVVGGDMARAGELLLESARIGLRRHALDSVAFTPVLASELGTGASLIGSVLLAAESTEPALGLGSAAVTLAPSPASRPASRSVAAATCCAGFVGSSAGWRSR